MARLRAAAARRRRKALVISWLGVVVVGGVLMFVGSDHTGSPLFIVGIAIWFFLLMVPLMLLCLWLMTVGLYRAARPLGRLSGWAGVLVGLGVLAIAIGMSLPGTGLAWMGFLMILIGFAYWIAVTVGRGYWHQRPAETNIPAILGSVLGFGLVILVVGFVDDVPHITVAGILAFITIGPFVIATASIPAVWIYRKLKSRPSTRSDLLDANTRSGSEAPQAGQDGVPSDR